MKHYITSTHALAAMAVFAAADKSGGGKTPTPVNASGYSFDELEIPAGKGPVGRGEPSKLTLALAEVPMGKSFLEPVEIPATITDAGEQEKAFKDEARKVTNRIGSAIRRHRNDHPAHNFVLRTVNSKELGKGVRVWRAKDSTQAEVDERKAKADAAKAAKNHTAATPPPPPPPTA